MHFLCSRNLFIQGTKNIWSNPCYRHHQCLGSCKLNSEGRQLRNLSLLFYESTDKTIKVADRMIELMDKSKKLMDNPKMHSREHLMSRKCWEWCYKFIVLFLWGSHVQLSKMTRHLIAWSFFIFITICSETVQFINVS